MSTEEERSPESAAEAFREATDLIQRMLPGPESNDPYLSGEVLRPLAEARVQESFGRLKELFARMDKGDRDRFFSWLEAYAGHRGGRVVSLLREYRAEMAEVEEPGKARPGEHAGETPGEDDVRHG